MLLFVRSNEVHFRVEHWDVNNENLHGDFYERHTGNPNITMQMFRDIHNVDQNVKLFLNEFGIVEGGNGNVATVSKGLQNSLNMRFPTMWYVRPAKAQTSLRIRAV